MRLFATIEDPVHRLAERLRRIGYAPREMALVACDPPVGDGDFRCVGRLHADPDGIGAKIAIATGSDHNRNGFGTAPMARSFGLRESREAGEAGMVRVVLTSRAFDMDQGAGVQRA